MVDAGDRVTRQQHVLVRQIADGEIVGIIADRHHGDDLLAVQEQGQRPFDDHARIDRIAVLVDAADRLSQARIVGVRLQSLVGNHGPASISKRPRDWTCATRLHR